MTPVTFIGFARPATVITTSIRIPNSPHIIHGIGAHFFGIEPADVIGLHATWNIDIGGRELFSFPIPVVPWVEWEPPPVIDENDYVPPDPNYHWFDVPLMAQDVDVKAVVTAERVVDASRFRFTIQAMR